jgi:hypothetical protein
MKSGFVALSMITATGQEQTVANGILLSTVQVGAQPCASQMARKLKWPGRGYS